MELLLVSSTRAFHSRILFGALVLVGAMLVGSPSGAADERLPTPPPTSFPKKRASLPTPPQSDPPPALPSQMNAPQPIAPQANASQPTMQPDLRNGGVLERSYYYHRQQPTAGTLQPMRSAIEAGCIPQANGWYNYGFPVQSYRYGWFGAERHDPRWFWTKGYYGDEIRTAYRRSY